MLAKRSSSESQLLVKRTSTVNDTGCDILNGVELVLVAMTALLNVPLELGIQEKTPDGPSIVIGLSAGVSEASPKVRPVVLPSEFVAVAVNVTSSPSITLK